MSVLQLTIPDEAMAALRMSPGEAEQTLRLAAAVKLYEIGRLSSGAAAGLAGIPRVSFLTRLSEYGVPTFRQTEDELIEELGNA